MQTLKKTDLLVAVIIGEIAAWLILILAQTILSPELYNKAGLIIKSLPIVFPIICVVCFYVAFLLSKKIPIIYQLAKFVLVGGLNTLMDWGVLALMIFVFKNFLATDSETVLFTVFSVTIIFYSFFKAISFIAATVNSYIWNKFWTFKRDSTETVGKEFLQFIIVSLIGFIVNVGVASGIFKWVSSIVGLNVDQWGILAAVVATAISMIWNFLGYKFIVFDVEPTRRVGENTPTQG
ncbi:GtrA family protein [Patescibacteria group bacterium]|nr:GtrA family protein [Patescibacteria group bacterium]